MITVLFYIINIEWLLLFLIFLLFFICELVLGLSLLVSLKYEYDHQKLNILNLNY